MPLATAIVSEEVWNTEWQQVAHTTGKTDQSVDNYPIKQRNTWQSIQGTEEKYVYSV